MSQIHTLVVSDFVTASGFRHDPTLTYQLYGRELGTAPVVLVNHALTGNSSVTGAQGWWNDLIGDNKIIDTGRYTILAFDIPGNGFSQIDEKLTDNYQEFTLRDIARIFLSGLSELKIKRLFAIIGGSIGGALAWEIAALKPDVTEHLIPIATDWKASDWLIANVRIQKQILQHSDSPLQDARMHAMTFYRSAASLKQKFARSKHAELDLFNVESWLQHHGDKLEQRFALASYKLLNHLLATGDITDGTGDFEGTVADFDANIHLIGIDSDGFYINSENYDTLEKLLAVGKPAKLGIINSIHGHDAFLIEYQQLIDFLQPVFAGAKDLDVYANSKRNSSSFGVTDNSLEWCA